MKTVEISVRTLAAVKRNAMNIAPLVSRKNKIKETISKLQDELVTLDKTIEGFEGGVKSLCGGVGSEYIVKKLVENVYEDNGTVKKDKNGNDVKKVSYVLTDNVREDKEKKCYVISIMEDADDALAQACADSMDNAKNPVEEEDSCIPYDGETTEGFNY